MAITRDPLTDPEIAGLMATFNRLSDGFTVHVVLNASLHMVAAAIGFIAKEGHLTLEQAEDHVQDVSEIITMSIRENWNRQDLPTDIEVKPQ